MRARFILLTRWRVEKPLYAIMLVLAVVALSGLESAYVQAVTTKEVWPDLLGRPPFFLLLALDLLVPLTVALLSRKLFMAYLLGQCFLSCILLHYNIFFYNTLTLSTIYHSMQGAASLGIDILAFARWDIIFVLGALLVLKLFLVRISMARRKGMPRVWKLRGAVAVTCMALTTWLILTIYGKTGLSRLWMEPKGHRPAAERLLEEGARESVRTIGYVATWLGEFLSGAYRDTALIYAEVRCPDPDAADEGQDRGRWLGLPVPPPSPTIIMIQAESLDYAALDMKVGGRMVMPFLGKLAEKSLVLKVFAPHKVGSCNSDYEILNGRVAEQNVLYYSYIKDYPDSVIGLLNRAGYEPMALHGLSGTLFNLRQAYGAQGFQRFYFKEEFLENGYQPGPYIMEHIMDEDLFKEAAAHLRPEGLGAQFIITMSSHVPFMEPRPEFKAAGGKFARYVSSLNYLDVQLAAFYGHLPQGTLLIIWGDHGSDVPYPRWLESGYRQVPFIVHLKGNDGWLDETREDGSDLSADGRIHSLCGLHYYLRRIFSAPISQP